MKKIDIKKVNECRHHSDTQKGGIREQFLAVENTLLLCKINEIVEWINSISERIGLMEDEYKQHLYGPGYTEIQRKD